MAPTQRLALPQHASWRRQFPRRHDAEDREKDAESHRYLVTQEEDFQFKVPLFGWSEREI